MQLRDWMRMKRWRSKRMAREIEAVINEPVPVTTVDGWRRGLSIPRPKVLEAIDGLTRGQVLRVDFIITVNERKAAA